ncbi:MAG: DUF2442 domain-containing protein [Phycisphaeraceae bacterium]
MLKDIVQVKSAGGYRLWLRFEDGVEGEIDVSQLVPFDGVFTELRDEAKFRQVRVDTEIGTIVWPGGADLDPDVLYSKITGRPIAFAE